MKKNIITSFWNEFRDITMMLNGGNELKKLLSHRWNHLLLVQSARLKILKKQKYVLVVERF